MSNTTEPGLSSGLPGAPVAEPAFAGQTAAEAQPTAAYPPYAETPDAPAAYGAPAYPQPGYGAQPEYAAHTPADRPKKLALTALILAIAGLLLVCAGFLPFPWIGLGAVLLGGLVLTVALVLGIIALASKKQGGTGLGIAAIVVAVVGGVVWIAALFASLVFIGTAAVSAAPDSSVSVAAGPYDEAAYLEQVRPEILVIMQEIEPSITDELLTQVYSDDMLITTGKGFLLAGDLGRTAFISSTSGSDGTMFTEDQAGRFFDAVLLAAQAHLAE